MRLKAISILAILVLGFFGVFPCVGQVPENFLANNVILIIRHSEKPLSGNGLSPQGEIRASLYADYFRPFRDTVFPIHIDSLFAGADSKNSMRPRLTLEPLSKAAGLPIDSSIGSSDPAALVAELRSHPHGLHPLIAWRHGELPALLEAFGASPQSLLPDGKWPADVFDWVVILKMGPDGTVIAQQLLHETLDLGSSTSHR